MKNPKIAKIITTPTIIEYDGLKIIKYESFSSYMLNTLHIFIFLSITFNYVEGVFVPDAQIIRAGGVVFFGVSYDEPYHK